MGFSSAAAGLIVPIVLVAAWTIRLVSRRRLGWRFFVPAFALALVCVGTGLLLGRIKVDGAPCPGHELDMCLPGSAATLWLNGLFGLGSCLFLLALGMFAKALRGMFRTEPDDQAA